MPKQIIKVRRSGIGVGDKKPKTNFRAWLDEQERKTLTYAKELPNKDGLGWTLPDFILEAHKRGISHNLHWGTAFSWARGSHPRELWHDEIREVFPTIRF